jgi:hypothetical protein
VFSFEFEAIFFSSLEFGLFLIKLSFRFAVDFSFSVGFMHHVVVELSFGWVPGFDLVSLLFSCLVF